jgi:hypothetical protein
MRQDSSKRRRYFDKVAEYKERFRRESSARLRRRLNTGSLYKEAAIAMREVLEERGEKSY